MKLHKFRAGQTVHYHPSGFGVSIPTGDFKIERLLPADTVENQYRVESLYDGHRRVVRESELSIRGTS
jgi:hypothetical protein